MEIKYIYGIIETAKEEFLGPCGVTVYEEVYTIPYRDISAVVSDSPFVDYTTLPKNQVARYLLRHQQVIEKIIDVYTIIPMKLGTYAFNIREVEEILLQGYALFKDIFRKINNKIEMDVVATWNDLDPVIKEIGEEQEIKELKEEIMSKPEGMTVEDQMMVGSRVKHILDKKRERCSFEIEAALKECSLDFRKHDLMDDRMIFNAAFLLGKDKKAEFEKRLDDLNALYNEKMNFRCVGPLPVYSFYTIETKKISFEVVDWARKKLFLDDKATKEEIIMAYRNSAKLCHPDKNTGVSGTEIEFNEINKACRILLEYCLSAEQAGQGDACSFNGKEIGQNAIIVQVRK
jgi:hypothetical protein